MIFAVWLYVNEKMAKAEDKISASAGVWFVEGTPFLAIGKFFHMVNPFCRLMWYKDGRIRLSEKVWKTAF
jgi:hypothetical protein